MLHPIVHDNRSHLWCGPAAIALMTGQPTKVIHRIVHELRDAEFKRRAVQGMSRAELVAVMRRLGWAEAGYPGVMCLGAPVLEAAMLQALPEGPFICGTDDHWFVLWRGLYADNRQPEPGPVPKSIAGERLVDMLAWRRVAEPSLPAASRAPSSTPEMREARRLADRYGIALKRLPGEPPVWVLGLPAEVDPADDVLEGEHECESPAEVLRKVRVYRDLVEHVRVHGKLC